MRTSGNEKTVDKLFLSPWGDTCPSIFQPFFFFFKASVAKLLNVKCKDGQLQCVEVNFVFLLLLDFLPHSSVKCDSEKAPSALPLLLWPEGLSVSTPILYQQTGLSALFISLLLILRAPRLLKTHPAFYLLFRRLLQVPLSSEPILRVYTHLFLASHPGDCVQANTLPCEGFPRTNPGSLIQVFPTFTANQHLEISTGKHLMGPAS